jgi:hypothetical protein
MVKTLTQEQARGVLQVLESLVRLGGCVDKIYLGLHTSFNCYSFGGGYGVSYKGCTEENYSTLTEFAKFYNLTWM